MMDKAKKNDKAFAEYEWMENMEEFDRQIEAEIWEEELIRCCIEQLLDEEDDALTAVDILQQQMEKTTLGRTNGDSQRTINGNAIIDNYRNGFVGCPSFVPDPKKSSLNPNAAVFVPRQTSS
ncbi:polyadenylate-binding protein-interacting protein 2-like [Xenia sp. Carnegie-2017]|uniref:polyadenylate-binding protein-interacting protein 2-like n=1 Tax=Xenia sp. Carnegie-2017 TaxID=2897299 RepID=UPI001F04E58B|nr:polyadenylate-binding protein-interacting protein 2-like [Xenia sp. Carnegie-2017]